MNQRATGGDHATPSVLTARRIGIHSQHETFAFMRTDCPVCRSEGLSARSQVVLSHGTHEVFATLYQVSDHWLGIDEVGLTESAWSQLKVKDGDAVRARHAPRLQSLASVRSRIFGNRFDPAALQSIVSDIVAGRYSDLHLASFITACATLPLDEEETIALTRVMVEVGERLSWRNGPIADKHSIGGLPGNRTTPIIVAIVAAHGVTIPKTSSRAITSPAGTADMMEVLAPVDLSLDAIRRVVEIESGCIVWGGSVNLSPADDIIIRVERALEIDTEGQLIASVLSKKIAAGSSHLVIDMPVGPTAKVRTVEAAALLSRQLARVSEAFGLKTKILTGDGLEPIGRGLGPALEARDVLAVLQGLPTAPFDLRMRASTLAGALLELAGKAPDGLGQSLAEQTIGDGRAWAKFQRICEAQGGMRTPPHARLREPLLADRTGRIAAIDNRKLATLAKLAGAPDEKAAGLEMHVRRGDAVAVGQPLCTVHAEGVGELAYALGYATANPDIIEIQVR